MKRRARGRRMGLALRLVVKAVFNAPSILALAPRVRDTHTGGLIRRVRAHSSRGPSLRRTPSERGAFMTLHKPVSRTYRSYYMCARVLDIKASVQAWSRGGVLAHGKATASTSVAIAQVHGALLPPLRAPPLVHRRRSLPRRHPARGEELCGGQHLQCR